MKIVVLIENTAPEGSCLAAEHGLSFYVEHRGKAVLLDAGASGVSASIGKLTKLGTFSCQSCRFFHGP